MPEWLRIHGSIIASRRLDDPAVGQTFLRAIELAPTAGTALGALRCAELLGALVDAWLHAEVSGLLVPICKRFTEGFATLTLVHVNRH